MKRFAFTLALLISVAWAQDSLALEPEYTGMVKVLYEGQDSLGNLEQADAGSYKSRVDGKMFIPIVGAFSGLNTSTSIKFEGTQSPVFIRSSKLKGFVFKQKDAEGNPAANFLLYRLTLRGRNRELVSFTAKANVFEGSEMNANAASKNIVPCVFKKHGKRSVKAMPQSPMLAGEYAIHLADSPIFLYYCFGVD